MVHTNLPPISHFHNVSQPETTIRPNPITLPNTIVLPKIPIQMATQNPTPTTQVVNLPQHPTPIEPTTTVNSLNLSDLVRMNNLPPSNLVAPPAPETHVTLKPIPTPAPLKNLVEPLPASALKGLIKIEPESTFNPGLVKVEHHHTHCVEENVFSPMASPESPAVLSPPQTPCNQSNGGGKIKSSGLSRKKSTSSTDEDDISNIPSLKMRIQVISQRVRAKITSVI